MKREGVNQLVNIMKKHAIYITGGFVAVTTLIATAAVAQHSTGVNSHHSQTSGNITVSSSNSSNPDQNKKDSKPNVTLHVNGQEVPVNQNGITQVQVPTNEGDTNTPKHTVDLNVQTGDNNVSTNVTTNVNGSDSNNNSSFSNSFSSVNSTNVNSSTDFNSSFTSSNGQIHQTINGKPIK